MFMCWKKLVWSIEICYGPLLYVVFRIVVQEDFYLLWFRFSSQPEVTWHYRFLALARLHLIEILWNFASKSALTRRKKWDQSWESKTTKRYRTPGLKVRHPRVIILHSRLCILLTTSAMLLVKRIWHIHLLISIFDLFMNGWNSQQCYFSKFRSQMPHLNGFSPS